MYRGATARFCNELLMDQLPRFEDVARGDDDPRSDGAWFGAIEGIRAEVSPHVARVGVLLESHVGDAFVFDVRRLLSAYDSWSLLFAHSALADDPAETRLDEERMHLSVAEAELDMFEGRRMAAADAGEEVPAHVRAGVEDCARRIREVWAARAAREATKGAVLAVAREAHLSTLRAVEALCVLEEFGPEDEPAAVAAPATLSAEDYERCARPLAVGDARRGSPCPVCLDPVYPGRVLGCGHVGCDACLRQWLTRGRATCPTCRRDARS